MKALASLLLFFCFTSSFAQSSYFPPTTGTSWDTLAPSRFGWCQPRIDSLYNFLESRNTKGFIILQDGKIVLEKYFGTFTADSIHYWASAGKSLTSMLTGIAQEKGLINITNPASDYLGAGWSSEPMAKEGLITIRNLLTMTSGMDDGPPAPCDNEDSSKVCLLYLQDPSTRWAYHTGAYKHLQSVISTAAGVTYNSFTNSNFSSHIGLTGFWYQGVYYSNTRGMARFGLLALNKAIWNTDTILHDTVYFQAMTNTSQSYNLSYGYLWWLNGKSSFMAPGLQIVSGGMLMSNAPSDMFCALGKNDQKIYVVPSQNLVVVRTGSSAYGVASASSPFDNELWGYINDLDLDCTVTGISNPVSDNIVSIYPNPSNGIFTVELAQKNFDILITDLSGNRILAVKEFSGKAEISCDNFPNGVYVVQISTNRDIYFQKLLVAK
jgi:CubicO group peptidase (beta-lactamase class C family)